MHSQHRGSDQGSAERRLRNRIPAARTRSQESAPARGLPPIAVPGALLYAQQSAGNRAVTGVLVQRTPIAIQRDATADRTAEVRAVMNGRDWDRVNGPWYLLNAQAPDVLVGVLNRLGKSGRAELAAHPIKSARYDKPRLDLAIRMAATGGSSAQVSGLDAIRNAVRFNTWHKCWTVLIPLSPAARKSMYTSIGRDDLRALLRNVHFAEELKRPALEAEINDVIAPPVKDVLLDFVPDSSELPDKGGDPKPLGEITVLVKGKPVMKVPARGGPWKSFKDKDNPGHTADPTTAGTFTLAPGEAIVGPAWQFSQIANGTPIRDTGKDIEFLRGGKWISVRTLTVKLDRDAIMRESAHTILRRRFFRNEITKKERRKQWQAMKASNDFSPLSPTWVLNDFGKEGFRILGTAADDIIHTTPETDDEAGNALKPGDLDFSHGCVHILGPDRQKLIEEGFLRGGVKIKVHPYDPRKLPRWGDPEK